MKPKPAAKKYLFRPKPGYVYVRVKGKYLGRITAPEGTAEFDRQYWEILGGKRAGERTSFAALINDYRTSDRYTQRAQRTRADYERALIYLSEKIGSQDVRQLTRAHVLKAMRANEQRTRFANYIAQMVSILCEHAIDLGWINHNPAKGMRKLETPASRRQAHMPWPDWAVDLFRKEAYWPALLIFEIGVGTAQRPADWGRFTWADFDGASLRLRQGKTGVELTLPCTERLRGALERAKTQLGAAPIGMRPILTKKDGGPMGYRYIASVMMQERKRLGLEAFDLHALRYRAAMELAWSGCSEAEIASFTGHKTKSMVAKYAGQALQQMTAKRASEKRR